MKLDQYSKQDQRAVDSVATNEESSTRQADRDFSQTRSNYTTRQSSKN